MSVGPLTDLSGGLIIGPTCVNGRHCSVVRPEPFNNYGPLRANVGGTIVVDNCNTNCCQLCCGPNLSSCCDKICGSPGTGSLDGSGYYLALASMSTIVPDYPCICCLPPSSQLRIQMPPPTLALAAVPGPGSAYSQVVTIEQFQVPPMPALSGMWINCQQSGVTLPSACAGVTFYQLDNTSKTYTVPASVGTNCSNGVSRSYDSGTGSGTPPNAINIILRAA